VIVIGGVCIGIANQLNVQASAMIGQLAIAISIGIGTVLSTYWTYLVQPAGDIGVLTAGVVCLVFATVASALSNYVRSRAVTPKGHAGSTTGGAWDEAFQSFDDDSETPSNATDVVAEQKTCLTPLVRGLLTCVAAATVASGWSLCAFYGTQKIDVGQVGVYTQLFYFQLGNMIATAAMCLLTLRRPLVGAPAPLAPYFKLSLVQHLKGFFTGCWNGAAFVLVFISGSSPFPPVLGVALFNLQPIVALLIGVFVLHELRGAPVASKLLVGLAIALFISAGIAFVSPLFYE
jgi:hypothetical protein